MINSFTLMEIKLTHSIKQKLLKKSRISFKAAQGIYALMKAE